MSREAWAGWREQHTAHGRTKVPEDHSGVRGGGGTYRGARLEPRWWGAAWGSGGFGGPSPSISPVTSTLPGTPCATQPSALGEAGRPSNQPRDTRRSSLSSPGLHPFQPRSSPAIPRLSRLATPKFLPLHTLCPPRAGPLPGNHHLTAGTPQSSPALGPHLPTPVSWLCRLLLPCNDLTGRSPPAQRSSSSSSSGLWKPSTQPNPPLHPPRTPIVCP